MAHNYILDEDFLLNLEAQRNREVYASITLLDTNENPIETLEGRVTSGSINIDGKSAVRRTCSLSLVANEININDFQWGIKNKFKLSIGLRNNVDLKNYDEIIWFKQGIYVIASFNVALNSNSYTINLSGKDKMCLLNGDLAGNIMNISEDFGRKWNWLNDEHTEYVASDIPIKDILYYGLQTYAGEQPKNIIINDIAECGYELLQYRGTDKTPMFLMKKSQDSTYDNMTINSNMECWFNNKSNQKVKATLGTIKENNGEYETEISSEINVMANPSLVYFTEEDYNSGKKEQAYYVYRLSSGMTPGYRTTDLTYAGDLIANAGDTFTSVLDKIVSMLGNFEYFYDLDGHFIFQRKRNWVQGKWSGLGSSTTEEGTSFYGIDKANDQTFAYNFDGNYFITNFSNSPNMANVKNDFSVWGKRRLPSGSEKPIHMRCAIDKKPEYYKNFNGDIYVTDIGLTNYIKYFNPKISSNQLSNQKKELEKIFYITDWREILYQMALDYYGNNKNDNFDIDLRQNNTIIQDNLVLSYYPYGKTSYERYYTDMEAFWRELYTYDKAKKQGTWNELISTNPEVLNFWIDFLDPIENGLEKYSVQQIGPRPKVVNESGVKAIYYRETPKVLFVNSEAGERFERQTGYTYIQFTDSQKNLFTMSSQGISAKEKMEQLLNQHTYTADAVNITCVPIYRLDVNTRITVKDMETNISGEYNINKISIPLTYNGTMTIGADRAATLIY